MFHTGSRLLSVRTVVVGAVFGVALLACPCGILAQHGGGTAGRGGDTGGAMGSGGRATGVSSKDDLKDFHAVLAVQATTQQTIAYASMLKSTEAASTEAHAFAEQLGKENSASELAGRGTTLDQALEKARTQNKKFLDGFSDRQKSGLKEISKRLVKADYDVAQQVKVLDQEIADSKAVGPQIAGSAQSLERALETFRSQQVDLGQEMSIAAGNGQDSAFNLLPVKNSIDFANQAIAITTTGVVSKGSAEGGQNILKFELTADMSDLQQNITDVLRTRLDKGERCGERIAIHRATLTPLAPASLVVVQLHFERWACFGNVTMNEMAEGNGTIEVKLTAAVGEDGRLRLVPEIRRVDAEGLVGELLRSGSLGEGLRDTITESLVSAMQQGGDFKATLPPAAQGNATLLRAQFQAEGAGKLMVVLDGEIRVPNEKLSALTSELQGRSAPQATLQEPIQESTPR